MRGVAARLAHEWPWCLSALLGGEARAPRMGAMSHAVAEARRAALSLPQSVAVLGLVGSSRVVLRPRVVWSSGRDESRCCPCMLSAR